MQWYYAINGQRQGPVTEAEFEQLLRDGVIRPDTLVWRQGMANWQRHGDVAPAAAPTPAASSAGSVTPDGTVKPVEDDTAICAESGKRYPKREMIQYEGKWISAEHRDAYFQRLREGGTLPGSFRYGGFWIRFAAKLIDGIILFVANSVIALILGMGMFAHQSAINANDPTFIFTLLAKQGLLMLINMGLGLLYSWFFLSRFSATPGKMALGLKVVRADGSNLSNGRIIGRYFAEMVSAIILYIGYIIAAFDDEKRALHDMICDTRVIIAR
ncbi:RDD family protein [Opitutaceae bacterium EW11]|nr:RDD family protein [Opitutaceae bacterium EW11]